MTQFTVLAIATDCALIDIGLYLAVAARFQDFRALNYLVHDPLVTVRVLLVVLTCVVVFYHSGLYDFRLMSKRRYGVRSEILERLMRAFSIVLISLWLFYFVDPGLSIGRGVVVLAAPIILAFTLGWRWLMAPGSPQLKFSSRL
jgi:hypothetical protein